MLEAARIDYLPEVSFSADTRQADLDAMESRGVDLLVVGGGITGAGIVRDAALRGIQVGLVERGDFASGTSSRSSKLIHGGVRYLQQGDIGLVLEAAAERRTLCRIAPHLAVAARMAMPVHGRTSAGLMKFRAGLWAFEKMARIGGEERHEVLKADEVESRIPGLATDRLQGAVVFTEYVTDDARLTLETIKSARRAGAAIASYAPAVAIGEAPARATSSAAGASSGGGLRVRVRDELDGREREIVARVVVNAAGPWVDAVRGLSGATAKRMHLTKGIHLVLARELLPVDDIVVMQARDRRPVFVVPWHDIVWIGTTDTNYPEAVERPEITREDVDYLLEATNRAFPRARLTGDQAQGAWAGVRPLLHQEGKSPSEISRRDEIIVEPSGLVSIAGGKLTTYRKMSERVVDAVVERLGSRVKPCSTAELPLVEPGEAVPIVRTQLGEGDVEHALQNECALTVADVLERRTRASLFARDNGVAAAAHVAEVMGRRLGWSDERRSREVEDYRRRLARDFAWRERGAAR